jgi:hypothetical protein
MTYRGWISAAALFVLLASPAFAAPARKPPAPPPSPERTVTGFYAAYVRLHPSGIPGLRIKDWSGSCRSA